MGGVSERVDQLEAAIDAVETAIAQGCGDPEVAVRLRAVVDRVEAACTRVLTSFAASDPQLPERILSLGSWWTQQAHALRTEAAARLAGQRVLDELPSFAAAVAAGRVGQAHLRLLAPAVTDRRLELARRDDAVLTDAAENLDPSRFRRVVAHWEALADDQLGDPTRPEKITEKRRLRLVLRTDGSWWLDGVLEPVVGEALQTALDAATRPPGRDDTRTGPQRRHDALADLVVGGTAAQVTVVVEAATGTATTAAGIVLPSWERDYLLCCAELTTVLVTASGAPFDAGSPDTMVPARTRRAVIARDRRCRFPGCDCPAKWCDVHHLTWKSWHGDNRIENLALLCRRHHRLIHKNRLRCRIDPGDGITFVVETLDGAPLADKPPNPKWKRPPDRERTRTLRRLRALAPPAWAA